MVDYGKNKLILFVVKARSDENGKKSDLILMDQVVDEFQIRARQVLLNPLIDLFV